jgi:hypothetical protein
VARSRRPPDEYEYEEETRRPPRRPPWEYENPWLWVGLLAVLVAAGVLIAYFAFRDDDDEPTGVTTVTTQLETEAALQPETQTETVTETETVITQPETVDVPDVIGQTQLEAGETVQEAGLVPDTYPVPSELQRGSVVSQNPPAGTELDEGEVVRLNISVGGGPRPSVQVPDVTGPPADESRVALWRAKLCVRTLTRDAPSQEEVGEVLAQQPSPGASVQQYAQVTIYVGT